MTDKKLIKRDIITSVAKALGLPTPEAKVVVQSVFDNISLALEKDESVNISLFGKFIIQRKVAREVIMPASGNIVPVPARKRVGFKCSDLMKERINEKS